MVSYYLPVIVTRDDDGNWNVEWDHEALLSLKTQLRVTRIGTVRFKGGVRDLIIIILLLIILFIYFWLFCDI